ncbi:MAG: hypothetical protein ABR597_06205 [Bacteroidales bacterium]
MQNQQKFLDLVENPYEFDKGTLTFLKNISESYPYCQSVQLLLAKNLQGINKTDFEKQVNRASAYAVSRRKFQRYISDRDKPVSTESQAHLSPNPAENKKLQSEQTSADTLQPVKISSEIHQGITENGGTKAEPAEKKDKLSLLEIVKRRLFEIKSKEKKSEKKPLTDKEIKTEDIIKEQEEKIISEEKSSHQQSGEISANTLEQKQQQNEEKHSEEELKPAEKVRVEKQTEKKPKIPDFIYGKHGKRPDINFLIDKFLKEEPRIKVSKDLPKEQEDLSAESTRDDPQMATETLAKVYLKQGKKTEALDVYEKLCLKFPEKSSYFAKKILEIKNEQTF